MSRLVTTLGIATLSTLLILPSAPAKAQTASAPLAAGPVAAPGPAATLAVSEIPGRLQAAAALVRRANGHASPLGSIQEIERSLPQVREGTRALLDANRELLKTPLSLGFTRELKNGWMIIAAKLSGWQTLLKQRSHSLQQDLEALDVEARHWRLAQEAAASQQLPADLQSDIARALEGIRGAQQSVLARRNVVLKLQTDVSEVSIEVDEIGELLDAALGAGRGRLFRLDSPPIWRPVVQATSSEGPNVAATRSAAEVLQYYILSILEFIAIQLSVFAVLLVTLLRLRKRAVRYQRDPDESVRRLGFAMDRPVSTSVLLAVVGGTIVTSAPAYLVNLGWYLLLVPLVRVVPGLSAPGLKPFLWTLAGLYVVDGARTFLPASSMNARVLSLLLALVGAGALVWYERRLRRWESGSRWKRVAQSGVRAGVVLLALAFAAESVGATDLSRHLEDAVLSSVCSGAALYASLTILRGLVQVVLRSRRAGDGSLWEMTAELKRALSAGVTWLAVVLYATLLLRAFELWDLLLAWAALVLRYRVSIGALSFTIGSAFAFVAVLCAAAVFSRVVRFFLAAGLQGRVEIQRGTTQALSKLAHYTILTIGFLLAVGASGVELSKFAVVIGGLGVGVGLGLQSVVNNFVSGLILLFERPLHVGDTITVGDTSGEVRDIGIRSSTIATWDGADVLIPNASLTSANVVNWTLSDDRRRGDVNVGVAYGTDPQDVLRILRETALAHPLVLREPAPVTLFIGFGESSLDFCVRYWTLLQHHVDVASQLHVGLCERLAAEGIEIPFPQRDLRLRDATPAVRASSLQSGVPRDR